MATSSLASQDLRVIGAKIDRDTNTGELRQSVFSGAIRLLYALGHRIGSRRILRGVFGIALKLEGGEFYSATARYLMRRWHDIDVAPYSYGCFDDIRFPGGVKVGRYVSIARSVRSYRRNHPVSHRSMHPLFYQQDTDADNAPAAPPLVIEHDAWIGAHALILPGCKRIGLGAVVGAGAVVTRDVEPFAIVAGNPARTVKYRFDSDEMARIMLSQWWNKPYDRLSHDKPAH